MRHRATARFWRSYAQLPDEIRRLADKNISLLQKQQSAILHYNSRRWVKRYWSVRMGSSHRALALEEVEGFAWFWIGTHAKYDRVLR